MLEFLVSVVFIIQIFLIYLLVKGKFIIFKEKEKGIYLKELPQSASYKDVEPDYKVVYDVMESIVLEDWDFLIDSSYDKFDIEIYSKDKSISIRSIIRISNYGDDRVRMSLFSLRCVNGSITVNSDDIIYNDVLLFLWNFIIDYKLKENEKIHSYYESTIESVNSNLKTLGRSRRLKEILK